MIDCQQTQEALGYKDTAYERFCTTTKLELAAKAMVLDKAASLNTHTNPQPPVSNPDSLFDAGDNKMLDIVKEYQHMMTVTHKGRWLLNTRKASADWLTYVRVGEVLMQTGYKPLWAIRGYSYSYQKVIDRLILRGPIYLLDGDYKVVEPDEAAALERAYNRRFE